MNLSGRHERKGQSTSGATQNPKAFSKDFGYALRHLDRDNIPSGYVASRGNVFMW